MRQQHLLIPTLREAPTEAEVMSHQLLVRAGLIRQVAAGIYTYLPLGLRVLHKVAQIIRQEMDAAGAQEILMPALQPAELWHSSGRYGDYGPELMRLQDRHQREFALGPTHEEVVTVLAADEISSYRKLPVILYQIQTKFRDERRPRFGLMRGREFMMKDAYSFDADWESLNESYWRMYKAYTHIFERLGLNFRAVEADAGTIGGEDETHEFMALAKIGEDTIVSCSSCDYAANLEKATASSQQAERPEGLGESIHVASDEPASNPTANQVEAIARIHTPGIKSIAELTAFTGVAPQLIIKTLIYKADQQYIAVLIRGDHEVNELKLKSVLNCHELELAEHTQLNATTGIPIGFAGPVGLNLPLLVDHEVALLSQAIAGANTVDYHYAHVVPGRDFALDRVHDLRNVHEGDRCPHCGKALEFDKGIEIGHVFKLGTKYSEQLGARYLDTTGKEQPFIMGCYGIGVSRILSAVVEQSHDEHGIIWPVSIAPFQVHIIPVSSADHAQQELAAELYQQLQQQGLEVLLDDRDERPGVKFKDADLIGIPVRITVGKRAGEGIVEIKRRTQVEAAHVEVKEIETTVRALLSI
ncbi:proline--tRNA ligase [Paenibacillus massiliensis]|uniref:proline--tRNA ligase n=1 Tax=Paenibacillus massiliensis TaxID=225917 RepID=UPI00036FC657|nr:proline--tRNA ligase [Paenibacillus massiliensis]